MAVNMKKQQPRDYLKLWLLLSTSFPIHDAVTIHCDDVIFLATTPSRRRGRYSWWWPFGGRNIDWYQSTCGIDCEDEGSTVIRNIRKYLPNDSADHRRTIFIASAMRALKV